jgi:DNA-binding NarL/FixJ family response regulator
MKAKTERNQIIIKLRQRGDSFTDIGRELNMDRTTAAKVWYRYQKQKKD